MPIVCRATEIQSKMNRMELNRWPFVLKVKVISEMKDALLVS